MSPPASDNTAAGMSFVQEQSLYMPATPPRVVAEDEEKDKPDTQSPSEDCAVKAQDLSDVRLADNSANAPESSPAQRTQTPVNNQLRTPSPTVPSSSPKSTGSSALPSVDHELSRTSEAQAWDFTHTPLSTTIPSSLFRPFAKYTGTQQSDRQMYNVCVTLLTIDIAQATLSGYLEICGLTPDHPELTTFFTGEIIGGPKQKHSFRTKDPSWGASNKTDMTHWARFPAWRPLSAYAKNDIEFVHPVDGGDWWQQEHIFMRWKEHFLVPDYKLRSIQGASFEGFYYICLNQMEGKISGIYFHSKSEKYQQLELKHEGSFPAWSRGVRPAVEFR
ncbi:uncharacterized protein HMPREF1541_08493 [Cyphellophora europaea CBS 101466]|uniref:Glucose-induced degradation protein 4 n=1 Tax=Cyphellophora europaea (strain CBS 101466) TaxID=1220924 RepID=W2RIA1_CYPE1|nr:uncharacterized protein HMPREF1541_08493 [Cyphellophora europaea CBS 101466]ETN36216.1 hypothetical protein HMPREF1541_08493 [Cyphellophora europaea CBS 101466]